MKIDSITVEILNWDDLIYRKDIASIAWFRMNTKVALDPERSKINAVDLGHYLLIASYAVDHKKNPIVITSSNLLIKGRFDLDDVVVSLRKFPDLVQVLYPDDSAHHTASCSADIHTDITDSRSVQHCTDERTASTETARYDFDAIKAKYPKRDGGQNWPEGVRRLRKAITSQKVYDQLVMSVDWYAAYCQRTNKVGTESVLMFSTFCNNRWREFPPKNEFYTQSAETKWIDDDTTP